MKWNGNIWNKSNQVQVDHLSCYNSVVCQHLETICSTWDVKRATENKTPFIYNDCKAWFARENKLYVSLMGSEGEEEAGELPQWCQIAYLNYNFPTFK